MASVWAKISNGVVQNIQMCSQDDAKDSGFVWVDLGQNPQGVDIGWTYDGTSFTAPVGP